MPGTGINYGNIRIPKWQGFYAGLPGNAYNGAGSTKFGLRENGTLSIKSQNVKDSNERDIRNADDMEFTANLLQTDLGAIGTLIALSRQYHSLWLPSATGDFYSFVPNTATAWEPNGTSAVGLHWKLVIEKDKRSIEAKWATRLFKKETEYLFANMVSMMGAGSGGGTGGVSSQAYNRANYRASNFTDVLIGGVSAGAFGDAKLEIESNPVFTDNKNREIAGYLFGKGEITMGQSVAAELTNIWTSAETDETISFMTPEGEEFRFVNGAVTTSPDHTHSEKEANVKVSFNGQIPLSLVTFPSAGLMSMSFTG